VLKSILESKVTNPNFK